MAVGLQLAGKNDFVRVQEDINDNLIKLDEVIDFNLLATLGIEYGGILNNTEAKAASKAYYDTTGKKLYKCIANTNLNYADAGFFEAISNNDLLGRLNDLVKISSINSQDKSLFGMMYDEKNLQINTVGIYGRELVVGTTVTVFGFVSGTIIPSTSLEAPFDGTFKLRLSKSVFPNMKTFPNKEIFGNVTVQFGGSSVDAVVAGAILRNSTGDGFIEISVQDYPFYSGAGGEKFQVASVRCEFTFVH